MKAQSNEMELECISQSHGRAIVTNLGSPQAIESAEEKLHEENVKIDSIIEDVTSRIEDLSRDLKETTRGRLA